MSLVKGSVMIFSRSGASFPLRMLKVATTRRVTWCRYPLTTSSGSRTNTDSQLKQSCTVAPAKALHGGVCVSVRGSPQPLQVPLLHQCSPFELTAVASLHEGHDGVGDRGANVGAHDDGYSRAHLQHWRQRDLLAPRPPLPSCPQPQGAPRVHSRPEETMLTMMEVEVEELCTSTVTRMPTTSPATGLERMALSLKMSPATLPAREREGRALEPGCCWLPSAHGRTSGQLESRAEHVQGADEEVQEAKHQRHLEKGDTDGLDPHPAAQLCARQERVLHAGHVSACPAMSVGPLHLLLLCLQHHGALSIFHTRCPPCLVQCLRTSPGFCSSSKPRRGPCQGSASSS